MSIYPGAVWRPLPENATQSRITPTQFIVHTAVDSPGPTDLDKYFGRSDVGAESHFWLPRNGKVVQMMDTNVKANANRTADVRAISIETEDDGDPEGIPWTASQLNEMEKLIRWCNTEHGIPLVTIPAHDKPGIGWHSMFGFTDPIAQTGRLKYNPWSYSYGKTCPGKTRIRQFREVLMPRLGESNVLKRGSKGLGVNLLQILLNDRHNAGLTVDGDFGPGTEAALKSYQAFLTVPQTGQWDKTTDNAHNFLASLGDKPAAPAPAPEPVKTDPVPTPAPAPVSTPVASDPLERIASALEAIASKL